MEIFYFAGHLLVGAEVGWDEEVKELQEKLSITQALLAEVRTASQRLVALPLTEWLTWEKARSARYNHYFSLLTLSSPRISAAALLRRISGFLRDSDILGLLDTEGRYHCVGRFGDTLQKLREDEREQHYEKVGIILPETDRDGTETALERLKGMVAAEEAVSFRMAVFPDDGTDPRELARAASA
ncbi:MAG: nucleotidyl cyclase domain-containing protein [Planctomycetota bacterium]